MAAIKQNLTSRPNEWSPSEFSACQSQLYNVQQITKMELPHFEYTLEQTTLAALQKQRRNGISSCPETSQASKPRIHVTLLILAMNRTWHCIKTWSPPCMSYRITLRWLHIQRTYILAQICLYISQWKIDPLRTPIIPNTVTRLFLQWFWNIREELPHAQLTQMNPIMGQNGEGKIQLRSATEEGIKQVVVSRSTPAR